MSASDPRSKLPARGGAEAQPSTADLDSPTVQGSGDLVATDGEARSFEEPELPAAPRGAPSRPSSSAARVAPDPEAGERVGGYELLEKLGKGGAGSVFRARRLSDGEIFAIKVLAASKTKRARIVQRFFDEVRAASAVAHPGLIRVVDFLEEEEPRRLAYAMEYLEGESLRDRIKRETALDLRDAIHIGVEVCDALDALHGAGIVHRDLKPENIMLVKPPAGSNPRVKLLDFGVVKFLPVDRTGFGVADGEDKPGTTFVGTPRYMAPEQAAGGAVDIRADLFAVGVVLFEMITGACPHQGDSLRDVVMAKLKGAPRIKMNPGKEILPQELTDIVDACLQLKPALRPKDAEVVARALRDATVILFAAGPVKAAELGAPLRPTRPAGPEDPVLRPISGRSPKLESGPMPRDSDAAAAPLRATAPRAASLPPSVPKVVREAEERPRVEVGPLTPGASRRSRALLLVLLVLAVLAAGFVLTLIALEESEVLILPIEPGAPGAAAPTSSSAG